MDDLDKKMDTALQARVEQLHAADDESGDGRVNAADMKLQLDRIEAQLELQDQQNRALLRGQRLRLWLAVAVAVVLCAAVAFLWHHVDAAYTDILQTSAQVNALATRVQDSLATLDNEELESMLQDLPEITEKLSALDVESLNTVLARIPELIDAVSSLQQKVEGIQEFFGGLGGLFGGR